MTAAPGLDAALRYSFGALALLSVAEMPWAAARLPDGAPRMQLLFWTAVISLLVTVPVTFAIKERAAFAFSDSGVTRARWILTLALPLVIVLVAALEFAGWPQFPDTFAELFHARVITEGHAWKSAPARPELLQIANTVVDGNRWYSQYPIGNVLLLAAGLLVGLAWLPALLIGSALAFGTYALSRNVSGPRAALAALALGAASPMLVLSSAAVMSQATTAAIVICALAVVTADQPSLGRTSGAGVLAGLAASVRPLDGLVLLACVCAFTLLNPAGQRFRSVAVLAAGAVAGVFPLLIGNTLTAGSPLRFGYNVLWPGGNLPGFGTRGWGIEFGPADALRNLSFDVASVNLALFEWPLPVMLLIAAAVFALPRPIAPRWRLLLGYTAAHIAVYFFYWHHDFFFGPRFLLPVVPVLLVLLADGAMRMMSAQPRRFALYARNLVLVQAVLAALLVAMPRYANARSGGVALAAQLDSAGRSQLPGGAVVLVNDGWGSRLFGEMWALRVSAPVAEQLYASADACTLQRALHSAAGQKLLGRAAEDALRTAIAGAGAGVPLGRPPAPALRLPAGVLPVECAAQLAFDERTRIAPFAPLLWRNEARADRLEFMRDPGPQSALPVTPGRAVFRSHPKAGANGPTVGFSMASAVRAEGGAN